jgi:acyl-CoA dehydrogenase
MSAVAISYPPDIEALREGLDGFLTREVIGRHERHAALLDNERRLFTDDGRYHPDALALIREVRMAAAQAGYYTMCVPESLGGGGLGHLAWFGGWERVFHRCSEQYWLGHYAISHWAFGPSAVLTQASPRARKEMLAPMMDGSQSMCFGMSEPDAGSDAMMMKSKAMAEWHLLWPESLRSFHFPAPAQQRKI